MDAETNATRTRQWSWRWSSTTRGGQERPDAQTIIAVRRPCVILRAGCSRRRRGCRLRPCPRSRGAPCPLLGSRRHVTLARREDDALDAPSRELRRRRVPLGRRDEHEAAEADLPLFTDHRDVAACGEADRDARLGRRALVHRAPKAHGFGHARSRRRRASTTRAVRPSRPLPSADEPADLARAVCGDTGNRSPPCRGCRGEDDDRRRRGGSLGARTTSPPIVFGVDEVIPRVSLPSVVLRETTLCFGCSRGRQMLSPPRVRRRRSRQPRSQTRDKRTAARQMPRVNT